MRRALPDILPRGTMIFDEEQPVDCVFEAYARTPDRAAIRLIHRTQEICSVDDIAIRASRMLWSLPLPDRQDLVVVRDALTGREILRRSINGMRHWSVSRTDDT